MAPPGILEARYRRLAGDEDRRRELYYARRYLGYGVTEWLELPWWHRRLYLEQANAEAEAQRPPADQGGGTNPADAILGGDLGDLAGLGFDTQ